MTTRYEYKVVEVREAMVGDKMSGDKVEEVLNDHGKDGWQLKAITSVRPRPPPYRRWRNSDCDVDLAVARH